jgi:hypothetical protein
MTKPWTFRKHWLWIFVPAALFCLWPAGAQEELDPLKVAADTHTLLYQNSFVRVISAKVPPGKTEPKHSHPKGVTVYLANYEIEQTAFPGKQKSLSKRVFGTVSWSDSVVHEIRNVGKTESHSIRIELK